MSAGAKPSKRLSTVAFRLGLEQERSTKPHETGRTNSYASGISWIVLTGKETHGGHHFLPNTFSLLSAADGLAPALEELLSLIQPAFLCAVLIRRSSLYSVDTGLHRTGSLLAVTQPGVRPSNLV